MMSHRWSTAFGLVLALTGAAACGAGEAPALGPALTLAESGGSRPTTAVDRRDGTAYIAWVGTEGGESNVFLSWIEPGAVTPGAAVRVNDLAGDAAPHDQAPAQVAVGPEGNVYVVWQNNTRIEGRRFPASDLRFARSTDGGHTFEPAVTVNDDAGGPPSSHTFHDLAVGADGTVYVSWIDSRERDRQRSPGPDGATGMMHGHGAADDALPGSEIRVAASGDHGRSFGASRVVDGDACPCCRTALAVGDDGAVYVAWRKVFDGNVRDVVVARAAPGARAFDAPVRVHADGWRLDACPHAGPSIALDGAGRLHIAWYTGREGRQGLYHAVSDDLGRSFSEPVALLDAGPVPPSQVRLTADAAGTVWAAWDDRRPEGNTVRLGRVRPGRVPSPTGGPAMPGGSPSLAADGTIRVLAWIDGDAVRARIAR